MFVAKQSVIGPQRFKGHDSRLDQSRRHLAAECECYGEISQSEIYLVKYSFVKGADKLANKS